MTVDSPEYLERVYAGVLGKTIGVMMGKPFEGWSYERITSEFGEIRGYIHDQVGYPLICTDDDTSGTFTFVRALEDQAQLCRKGRRHITSCGYGDVELLSEVTSREIGNAWLNYLVENRSVLWWGGMGASTEHTAYLRLKSGIDAPESGSAKRNGKRVSEQIGAQIFIDSWAMLCPGEPDLAVDLARRAASVSHDGEAIYGAQVIAAMEALAFVESDLSRLVDCALDFVPADSMVARVVRDVREWAVCGDWRETRSKVAERYGADIYGVGHVIPNHALIHLALWHGGGDFAESLSIVNTCGWDTDCNSGNLGCLLGIRNGLGGIPAGLRDPIADRLYLPTADSGRGITDCLREAVALVDLVRPCRPKNGARFHFSLPGAVQGFSGGTNPDGRGLHIDGDVRSMTPTFIPPSLGDMHGYELMCSPTIYPGQRLRAYIRVLNAEPQGNGDAELGGIAGGTPTPRSAGMKQPAPTDSAHVAFLLRAYDDEDETFEIQSPWMPTGEIEWTVPDLGGQPIYEVGIAAQGGGESVLEFLTWDGPPDLGLSRATGEMSRRMWVEAADSVSLNNGVLGITQNNGLGLALLGCREWQDYELSAIVTPRTGGRFGIAINVHGLRRYLALVIDTAGTAELQERYDTTDRLCRQSVRIDIDQPIAVTLKRVGNRLVATVGGARIETTTSPDLLGNGGIALLCEECRADFAEIKVTPLKSEGRKS